MCCSTTFDSDEIIDCNELRTVDTQDEKEATGGSTVRSSTEAAQTTGGFTYHKFSVENSSSISSFTLPSRLREVSKKARKSSECDDPTPEHEEDVSTTRSVTPDVEPQRSKPFPKKKIVEIKKWTYESSKVSPNGSWSQASPHNFLMRTGAYLQRRKQKLKEPCEIPAVCQCIGIESFHFESDELIENVPSRPHAMMHSFCPRDYFLIFNMVLTGANTCVSLYYLRPPRNECPSTWLNLWDQFENGSDDFRNKRLKMYPIIQEGPYALRKIAGKKPVIIGQKIPITYYKGSNFFEINLMCDQNNTMAKTAVKMAYGIASKLVVDLAFILQAETFQELPELITASVRCEHLHLSGEPWKLGTEFR